jgi:hypothetical protein
MTIFYSLRFETPPTWREPQEQGGPIIPPSTGLPFRRLLRLAGLWWRHSIPPAHGQSLELAWVPPYIAPGRTQRNTTSLNNTSIVLRCCGSVFAEPLPSSGRLLWLHYSGLQTSCHNMVAVYLHKQFRTPTCNRYCHQTGSCLQLSRCRCGFYIAKKSLTKIQLLS